jgi:hypothetical protein
MAGAAVSIAKHSMMQLPIQDNSRVCYNREWVYLNPPPPRGATTIRPFDCLTGYRSFGNTFDGRMFDSMSQIHAMAGQAFTGGVAVFRLVDSTLYVFASPNLPGFSLSVNVHDSDRPKPGEQPVPDQLLLPSQLGGSLQPGTPSDRLTARILHGRLLRVEDVDRVHCALNKATNEYEPAQLFLESILPSTC